MQLWSANLRQFVKSALALTIHDLIDSVAPQLRTFRFSRKAESHDAWAGESCRCAFQQLRHWTPSGRFVTAPALDLRAVVVRPLFSIITDLHIQHRCMSKH